MNFDELSQWCIERRTIPEDLNEPFVVSYQINIDGDDAENFPPTLDIPNPECSMRLFISTKHLLLIASKYPKDIQADATYKLIWLGFPVLIIGISDMNKVFHPFELSLSRDEKTNNLAFIFSSLAIGIERSGWQILQVVNLLADAAHSITPSPSFYRCRRECNA